MDKNQQYSLILWLSFILLIMSHFLVEQFLDIPETMRFLFIFIDFLSFMAGIFAVYYSYLVLEKILKKKKKRKMAIKSKEDEKK